MKRGRVWISLFLVGLVLGGCWLQLRQLQVRCSGLKNLEALPAGTLARMQPSDVVGLLLQDPLDK